jgi:hypothetical protein
MNEWGSHLDWLPPHLNGVVQADITYD